MRARALALVFVTTAAGTLAALAVACSTPSSPPQEADGSTGSTSSAATTGPGGEETTGAASDPSKPASGEPASQITNDPPDGGVVMNNATTSGDAGASDRLDAVHAIVKHNRDKYRACFDIWGKKNPTAGEQKVMLTFDLDPAGKVTSVAFNPSQTDITDKGVETCMANATKAINFPPSPSEKETTVQYPFRFKPKP